MDREEYRMKFWCDMMLKKNLGFTKEWAMEKFDDAFPPPKLPTSAWNDGDRPEITKKEFTDTLRCLPAYAYQPQKGEKSYGESIAHMLCNPQPDEPGTHVCGFMGDDGAAPIHHTDQDLEKMDLSDIAEFANAFEPPLPMDLALTMANRLIEDKAQEERDKKTVMQWGVNQCPECFVIRDLSRLEKGSSDWVDGYTFCCFRCVALLRLDKDGTVSLKMKGKEGGGDA